MPRFEYIDNNGDAHLIYAPDFDAACDAAARREMDKTGSVTLADRAVGTVEVSDERSRAA